MSSDLLEQLFVMKNQCPFCFEREITMLYKLTKQTFRIEKNHFCSGMDGNVRLTWKYNISKMSAQEKSDLAMRVKQK